MAVGDGKAQGEPRLVKSDLGNGEPLHLGRNGVLYQSLFRQDIDAFVADFDSATGHVGLPARSVNERRERSGSPRWSADGLTFVYLAVDESDWSWTLVIRSGPSGVEQRVPVRRPLNYPQRLSPSPDGRVVALEGFEEGHRDGIYGPLLVDLASGVLERIVITSCDTSFKNGPIRLDLSWSPDGKALYHKCRARDAAGVILVMRRDVGTGAEEEVYKTSLHPGEMVLSPDGTRFAFKQRDASGENRSVLVSMDVASGQTKELDHVPAFLEFQALAWSADGKRILYCKKQEGGSDLWWVPAAGGTPERLAHLGQSIFTLAMDPAGKRIAWTAKSTTSEVWALENLLSR